MNLAVVILNFNGKSHLERFLPSVVLYSNEAQIYVADNCSTDDSVDFLKEFYPNVRLILLPQNFGFAGGYNKALGQIEADFYVLLNSDVEVTPNWLDAPTKILSNSEEIVAVQPKIKSFHNKDYFEYAGAAGGELDIFGYAFCRGRLFESVEIDEGQYQVESEIFWASGACLFIKAKIFHDFSGFDERFFAHMEEIDLCWRIQNEGFKIYYTPFSEVFHVGGGTLNKSNTFKTFLNYRNNLSMLFKNLPTFYLLPILFFRLILDGISSLLFLKNGDFKNIFAIIRAHFSFYGMVPYLSSRRSANFEGFKKCFKSPIILKYFVLGKKKFTDL